MQLKTKKLLSDIEQAAAFILKHTGSVSLDDYVANDFLRLSVERQFEIIGEAARRILLSDPHVAVELADLPQIVSFRNLIAHGYDELDHARVLAIAHGQLPALLGSVERLLDRQP